MVLVSVVANIELSLHSYDIMINLTSVLNIKRLMAELSLHSLTKTLFKKFNKNADLIEYIYMIQ